MLTCALLGAHGPGGSQGYKFMLLEQGSHSITLELASSASYRVALRLKQACELWCSRVLIDKIHLAWDLDFVGSCYFQALVHTSCKHSGHRLVAVGACDSRLAMPSELVNPYKSQS